MSEAMTVIKTDTGDIKLSPQIIKKYLVRGNGDVNEQEVMMFLSLCKFQKLNPFLNEAYLIKFGSKTQMIVGKETFTKRASNDPRYRGMKAGVIIERAGEIVEIEGSFKLTTDKVVGGWAEIHINNRIPFKHSVAYDEYVGTKGDGTINAMWKSKPATMIRKVAVVQALREAFPELFQGMYEQAETNVDNEYLEGIEETPVPTQCVVEEAKTVESEVVEAEIVESTEVKEDKLLISSKQNSFLFVTGKEHGMDQEKTKQFVYDMLEIDSLTKLEKADFNKVIKQIEKLPKGE